MKANCCKLQVWEPQRLNACKSWTNEGMAVRLKTGGDVDEYERAVELLSREKNGQ